MNSDRILDFLTESIKVCDYIISHHNYGFDRQSTEILREHSKQARFLKEALEYERGDYDIHT